MAHVVLLVLADIAPNDLHDGVLAQSDVPTDQAIAEAITVQVEHLLCLLVAGSLTLFPTQDDATGLGRLEA